MSSRPQLAPLLEAALDFWHVDARIEPGVQRHPDAVSVVSETHTITIDPDAQAPSGWWIRVDDRPALWVASVVAVLREVRVELDPEFVPGKALIGARVAPA